jgi:hypothetical protein
MLSSQFNILLHDPLALKSAQFSFKNTHEILPESGVEVGHQLTGALDQNP